MSKYHDYIQRQAIIDRGIFIPTVDAIRWRLDQADQHYEQCAVTELLEDLAMALDDLKTLQAAIESGDGGVDMSDVWTEEMERDRLAEERAVEGGMRLYPWLLPLDSEIKQFTPHERNRHQQDISSALEMTKRGKAEGWRWLIGDGPPRYGPGERQLWIREQDERYEP